MTASTTLRRTARSATVLTLAIAGLAVPGAAAGAAAGACHPLPRTYTTVPLRDIDGDRYPDLVVGLPSRTSSVPGALDIHGSRSGNHVMSATSFAGVNASAGFGKALSQGDVNGDGCEDVAVGDPTYAGGGAVVLAYGGDTGVQRGTAVVLKARTAADRYGSAVSVSENPRSGAADVWIGAPGRTVSTLGGAGAIDHYTVSASGVVTLVETITQADTVAHAAPQAGVNFGSVLAQGNQVYGGAVYVAVGTPAQSVDGKAGAGSVTLLTVPPAGKVSSGQFFTQDSSGVSGVPEAGDHFGAALTVDGLVGIGVPGEDLGTLTDAGLVQFLWQDTDYSTGTALTQDSSGVPGVAEAGDRFGSALAASTLTQACCDDPDNPVMWIGAPGESLGAAQEAGDVTKLSWSGERVDRIYGFSLLYQGPGGGLGGVAETGDHVGQTLGSMGSYILTEGLYGSGVAIGDPGENLPNAHNAGMVIEVTEHAKGPRSITYSGGPKAEQYYGSVLAVAGPGPS